jgi:transcriptional regulator with XRE-family HTH domain
MEPGEIIKEKREAIGWSQADLAKRVGVSQVAIRKMEGGITRKSKFFPKVAEVLGIELHLIDRSLAPTTRKTVSSMIDAQLAAVLGKIPPHKKEAWLQLMIDSLPPEERAKHKPASQARPPAKRR